MNVFQLTDLLLSSTTIAVQIELRFIDKQWWNLSKKQYTTAVVYFTNKTSKHISIHISM